MSETKESIKYFIDLNNKTEFELRATCRGIGLTSEGSRKELIDRLLSLKKKQSSLSSQAIPLRTKNRSGQPLKNAIKSIQQWRKILFEQGQRRKFFLLNKYNQPYSIYLKSIKCSSNLVKKILEEGWYLPVQNQKPLIDSLKKNPEAYMTHVVQKTDKHGNSWLMLHVSDKEKTG